jgi:hypothetical protein
LFGFGHQVIVIFGFGHQVIVIFWIWSPGDCDFFDLVTW